MRVKKSAESWDKAKVAAETTSTVTGENKRDEVTSREKKRREHLSGLNQSPRVQRETTQWCSS